MDTYKYRRWKDEEDKLLQKIYNKHTLNELAIIFDRSWNKVGRRAIRLGIKKTPSVTAKRISKTHKKLFADGVRSNKGEKNPNWKGGNRDRYGGIESKLYNAIHTWLKKVYGKSYKCEMTECKGTSKTFQWAKIMGKEYDFVRENFFMLCKSCHVKYDKKK